MTKSYEEANAFYVAFDHEDEGTTDKVLAQLYNALDCNLNVESVNIVNDRVVMFTTEGYEEIAVIESSDAQDYSKQYFKDLVIPTRAFVNTDAHLKFWVKEQIIEDNNHLPHDQYIAYV